MVRSERWSTSAPSSLIAEDGDGLFLTGFAPVNAVMLEPNARLRHGDVVLDDGSPIRVEDREEALGEHLLASITGEASLAVVQDQLLELRSAPLLGGFRALEGRGLSVIWDRMIPEVFVFSLREQMVELNLERWAALLVREPAARCLRRLELRGDPDSMAEVFSQALQARPLLRLREFVVTPSFDVPDEPDHPEDTKLFPAPPPSSWFSGD